MSLRIRLFSAIVITTLVLLVTPRVSEAVHALLTTTPGLAGVEVANLTVTKTGPATASAGSNVSFTVQVTNAGPDSATTVSLTDNIPAGLTFVSVTQNNGPTFDCSSVPLMGSGGTITCTIATLAAAASANFTFVMHVPAETPAGTTFVNTATGTSQTSDPDPDNNSGTTSFTTNVADIGVVKTGPASAPADTNVSFDVTIINSGPGDAAGVSLIDTLPAGMLDGMPTGMTMTFVSNTQNSGPTFSCTNPMVGSSGTITCTIASLPLNASATFTFVMHIPSGTPAGTTFTNIATGTATTPGPPQFFDPNGENNSSPASVTVPGAASADLFATKSAPEKALPDTEVPFSIVITNGGPTAATNVSFSDTLPGNMTFVGMLQNTGPSFNCSSVPMVGSGGTVTCTLASMNSGETATFTLTTHIPAGTPAGTEYQNSVTVSSTTPDPNSINNTGFATVRASAADMSITKTGSSTAIAGDNIVWTITLTNGGPDSASGAAFVDQLPVGTKFVSLVQNTGPTADCSLPSPGQNGIVNCSIASLSSEGGSAQFTLTASVDSNVANDTVISNTATASSSEADPNPNNNSSTFPTTINTSADLSVTKTDLPDPVNAGSNLTYTITVTNNGLSDAASVELTDLIPTNTTFVSFTIPAGWTRTDSVPVGGTGTVKATRPVLADEASAVFTLVVKVNSNTPAATQITNAAVASSSTADNNTENNQGSATTVVATSADISVTKVDSPDPVTAGLNVTYTITATNNGPSDAVILNFSDTLPAGTTLVSFTVPGGWTRTDVVPSGGTGTVTATAPTLASGASAQFTLVVNVGANTPTNTVLTNTATVTSQTTDINPNNNSGTATTTVGAQPDLTITKTHTGNFSGGQTGASYTIRVTNSSSGPTNGSSVTVTDVLPTGLTPTGPTGTVNGWFCTINGQTLTCVRSDVLAGNSSYPDIILTVNVINPAPSSVTNTATVSGGGDSNPNNNSASDPTNIDCSQNFGLNNTNPLMISRFRMNGPAGPLDEFVEIYNPLTIPHTVASGNCGGGGYGIWASAGNGTTANSASLVCQIPNGTVIPAGGYYLCTGVNYSLKNLGRNGGVEGATAIGDTPIGCNGQCSADIRDDAGLALMNVTQNVTVGFTGFDGGVPQLGFIVYDKVGFGPYGQAAPAPARPALADHWCEGGLCLQPVGDASTGAACVNPTQMFPVFPVPPACYGLAGQYEFLRRQTTFDANLGTVHQDTNRSPDDFILLAPNPSLNMGFGVTGIMGVSGILGASVPQNSQAPPDMPRVSFTQAPFDGTNQLGPRNAERNYSLDPTVANPANDPQGTFVLRFRYTNNSGKPITPLRFRVDNLSTLCGPQTATPTVGTGDAKNLASTPDCATGTFTSVLKVLNSTTELMTDSGGTTRTVFGTVLEDLSMGAPPAPGPLSPLGGGIDNTLIVNPSGNNASVGDGVTGGTGLYNIVGFSSGPASIMRLKFKFGVVQGGRFIILITPMAKFGPTPLEGVNSGDQPSQ